MKQYPSLPTVADAPDDLLAGGHLWLQEYLDGAHLRFQLRESGALRFGDRDRVFDPDDVPLPYRHAVRHVRERLDRDALRSAVPDVEAVVFFAEAMHRHAVAYDWERTPSVLGFDVWSGTRGQFLPPDAVEKILRRLGLDPVNAFRKEVRAADFHPDRYQIPDSNWYDGPAAGVVVRTKTGQRAKLLHPGYEPNPAVEPFDASPAELARTLATGDRIRAIAAGLAERGRPVTTDAVLDRTLEAIYREEHHRLFDDASDVGLRAFRSAVAARTQELLADRE
ncbi:RNA ligase family protein [Halobacteriaceae archaeon GCM10025711]